MSKSGSRQQRLATWRDRALTAESAIASARLKRDEARVETNRQHTLYVEAAEDRDRSRRERDAARSEVARLTKERIATGQDDDGTPYASAASWRAAHRIALDRASAAEATAERLREGLRAVEWVEVDEYDDKADTIRTRRQCVACWEYHPDDPEGGGHTLTCSTRRALAASTGNPTCRDCAHFLDTDDHVCAAYGRPTLASAPARDCPKFTRIPPRSTP